MSMTEPDATERSYEYVLQCPWCAPHRRDRGRHRRGVHGHLAELHPDLADTYERHHILFMAVKYRR
jgi:hypothetical protein